MRNKRRPMYMSRMDAGSGFFGSCFVIVVSLMALAFNVLILAGLVAACIWFIQQVI